MRSLVKGRCWKGPIWFCAGILVGATIAFVVFGLRDAFAPALQPTADKTLIKAIILFRHGDRHTETTYPTDPYRFEQYWPDGRGALNKEGKQHMYQLGRNLRARYSHFLDKLYFPEEVVMESTNIPRCLMSAQMVLAGLYPPTGPQVWSSDLLWQPIPVYIGEDKKLYTEEVANCPKIVASYLHGKEVKQLEKKNKQLLLYVANHSHVNATVSQQMFDVFGTFLIQSQLGMQLPEWVTPISEEYMQLFLSTLHYAADTQERQRVMSGPFLGDVVKYFMGIQSKMKARLYSVQDVFLRAIYQVLTARDVRDLNFGSTMLIELHSAYTFGGEQLEVKLWVSSNYTWEDMHAVDMSQCGSPCYLEAFLKILLPLIPDNWEEECLGEEVTSQPPNCVTIPSATFADVLVTNFSVPKL